MTRTKVVSRISVAFMVIGLLFIINLAQPIWVRIVASLGWVALTVAIHTLVWQWVRPQKELPNDGE